MSQVSELTCPPASIGNSIDTMLAASVGNLDMLVGGASSLETTTLSACLLGWTAQLRLARG